PGRGGAPMVILRLVVGLAVAALPSRLKLLIYRRLFGYRIGRGVKIGLSPLVNVGSCRIGDDVRIGAFNLFTDVGGLEIGRGSRIGFLNLVRGGGRVRIGDYSTLLRQNTINAIIDGDFVEPVESNFSMGTGAVLSSGHWLDFSAGIELGDYVIVGG